MSGFDFTVRWDTGDLDKWVADYKRNVPRALRSGVDKIARFARAEAVKTMARDINLPLLSFRSAVPLVARSMGGGPIYRATWTVGRSDNPIRGAGAAKIGKTARGAAIAVSSYAVSGGGSADLVLSGAFTFNANGGRVVAIRLEHGKGTHRGGSRSYRAVYAERPSTAMQGNRAPLRAWTKAAETAAPVMIRDAMEAAFHGSATVTAGRFYSADAEGA